MGGHGGERAFRCLRVIDVGPVSEEEVLIEAFVDERGRTVLARRYNGRLWAQSRYKTPWDERLPDALRIVIDGVTFVHWYDCLTDVAFSADRYGEIRGPGGRPGPLRSYCIAAALPP